MRTTLLALFLGLMTPMVASAGEYPLAPDWSLASAGGDVVTLSEEVQERPVVLLFWATWCPYCKALMPHLHSIRLEYGDAIEILAVNFREDGDPVAFVKDHAYDFTVLPDGDDVAAAYRIFGTPGVLIVDTQRQVRFDLRALPPREPPGTNQPASHKRRAAYLAPYWAAEIRKSIDGTLADSERCQ